MFGNSAVLLTGSAGGVGQALVRAFSDAGYIVIGLDRGTTPGAYHSLEIDLAGLATSDDAFDAMNNTLNEALGSRPLAALVNNAAIQVLGTVNDLSVSDFRSTMDVNLVAAFALVKLTLPYLETNNGCVINVGSIHGRLTKPRFSAYATSKGALETLTRALAVELGDRIRVNAISPAAVDTPMLRAGFEEKSEALNALAECHPAGRISTATEVAELAVFLTGNSARFINGAVLDINGAIGSRLHDPV